MQETKPIPEEPAVPTVDSKGFAPDSTDIEKLRLAAIVDSAEDAILSISADGIITSWNKGAEKTYGYSAAEIVGQSVSVLAPADKIDEITEILNQVGSGEHIRQYETVRQRRDGTLIDVSLTVSPIKDSNGTVVGASTIAREITEEKRLRDIRNFLAAIVDSSDDAILSKDLDGIILSWNKGAQKLYGYTQEEVLGKHVSMLTPSEYPDEIPRIMERLKRGESIDHYETVRVAKDGKRIYISLSISPVKNSNGKIIAASAIARDISTRKQHEEERARLFEELTISLNEKNILLQEVYHRVKNNLQVISSLLDLRARYITDPVLSAAFKESISRVQAMALVHEQLYQTRNLDRIDFGTYLQSLFQQLYRSFAPEKTIELEITGDRCFLSLNSAIPLGLIFNELVTNSLKHAFPTVRDGKLMLNFRIKENQLLMRYSDNGKGLPSEFDFRNNPSFGFRIVRLLTNQLKGKIAVRSENGTIFEIRIPLPPSGGIDLKQVHSPRKA